MSNALSRQLQRVLNAYCIETNTPRALSVFLLAKYGEYRQLVSLRVDPRNYLDPESYHLDVRVTDFLRKFGDLEIPGISRSQVASRSFVEAEAQCRKTNDRLDRFIHNGPFEPQDLPIVDFIANVKECVKSILGPIPKSLTPRFGPGSTFEDRGSLITIPDKMSSRPTVTQGTRCLLPFWERTAWAKALMSDFAFHSDPKVVRGNRFTTVPKDSLKDRGICIEPSLNVSFQLDVGRQIRDRLLRSGIDLLRAQPLHRKVAQFASRTGMFATIDLSSASDTVSYKLVQLLLPKDWFELLDSLRSPFTFFEGKWVRLEKFSSMGNGFTFELETLLFLALCRTVCLKMGLSSHLGEGVKVFGDDIIVPTASAGSVVAVLRWFGFAPNPDKTFLEGPFRESCGGDFFDGVPVRAFYLKGDPNEPSKVIALANGIRRVALSEPSASFRWTSALRAWGLTLDMLPNHIRRIRGPEELGDLVVNDRRESYEPLLRTSANGGRLIRVYQPIARSLDWAHWKHGIRYASALYGVPSTGPIPRNGVFGYRMRWIHLDGVSWLPSH